MLSTGHWRSNLSGQIETLRLFAHPIEGILPDLPGSMQKEADMKHTIVLCVFLALGFAVSVFSWTGSPPVSPQETQPEYEMTVPEGTVIPIVVTAYLNTRSSQVGDTLYADTTYPIWIQQRLVIPKGSTIRGTVTGVMRPGKIKGKGSLALRFDDILLPNGVKRDVVATFKGIHGAGDETIDPKSETVNAGSSKGADVGTVVATTSQGAIIGALVDHSYGTGAAIGAGAGAAAGLATVLFTRGRDLVISPGTQFDLQLQKPLKFAYNELDFSRAQLNSARPETGPKWVSPDSRGTVLDGRKAYPMPGIGIPGRPIF
jgi:hypothetical protein